MLPPLGAGLLVARAGGHYPTAHVVLGFLRDIEAKGRSSSQGQSL